MMKRVISVMFLIKAKNYIYLDEIDVVADNVGVDETEREQLNGKKKLLCNILYYHYKTYL